MQSLSDQLLADSFATSMVDVHGETVTVLTGACANQSYNAVVLVVQDAVFIGEVTRDKREKISVHFPESNWPQGVKPEDLMKDGYGITWRFGDRTNNQHDNTVDFECNKYVKET